MKVPAGEFETWKVEMTPADGGAGKATLWIGKSNRRMVKLSAVIPEMGGAKMTMEWSSREPAGLRQTPPDPARGGSA